MRMMPAVLLALLLAPGARAGLYLSKDADPWPFPTIPRAIALTFGDRQSFGRVKQRERQPVEVQNSFAAEQDRKKDYVKELLGRERALKEQAAAGKLSVEDRIDLGAIYILGKKPDQAIAVLSEALKEEPKNYKVLANLATAYFASNLHDRATSYQEQMLSPGVWPKRVEGWPPARLRWQRRAENYFLTLMQKRAQADRLQPGGPRGGVHLDALFPGVRFSMPDGQYAAGEISPRSQDRLPPDAVELVAQILRWQPDDLALQWLLAELYNARGEVRAASQILDFLRGMGLTGPNGELEKHREALKAEVERNPGTADPNPPVPRQAETPGQAVDAAPPPGDNQNWLPDWKTLGVGFGAGALVGMLLVLQLRLVFRRRA
jgi:tetratricopeptide (TPR) repeat protein